MWRTRAYLVGSDIDSAEDLGVTATVRNVFKIMPSEIRAPVFTVCSYVEGTRGVHGGWKLSPSKKTDPLDPRQHVLKALEEVL